MEGHRGRLLTTRKVFCLDQLSRTKTIIFLPYFLKINSIWSKGTTKVKLYYGKQHNDSSKTYIELPFDLAIALLYVHLK